MVVNIVVMIYTRVNTGEGETYGGNELTAKLTPFATSTIELMDFVPLPQGSTHCPDAFASVHDEPTPLTGSKPAEVAKDWKSVIEYPAHN